MKFSFFNNKPKDPINPDLKAQIKKTPLSPEGINKLFSSNTSRSTEQLLKENKEEEN